MLIEKEIPAICTKPVLDNRGFVILFDLWVEGKWVGSRRTAEQCAEFLSWYIGVPIEPTADTAW